ncbi:MAG: tetratricopeptide repeat-containing sensor histidine kinase [Alphaproteobacteria bacterium]
MTLRIFLIAIALLLFGIGPISARNLMPADEPRPDDAKWAAFQKYIADAKGSMMGDPGHALDLAREAEDFAADWPRSPRVSQGLATSLWLQSEALARINRVQDARTTVERALELARSDGVDTKLDGDLNLSLARIADLMGDLGLALKSYHAAHDVFAAVGDARGQSMALQGLGSIYDAAHDFRREIEYYERAHEVYSGDPPLDLANANNLADAFKQLGRYDDALADFQRALKISEGLDSKLLRARILTNIASVYVKKGELRAAQATADKALATIAHEDDGDWSRFIWGVKAEIEYRRGVTSAAVSDIEKTFQGVDLKATTTPFRDMHEMAYKIYLSAGNYAHALAHHEAFKRLDDEGRAVAANVNQALLGAQFDFATQKLEIEKLKTEQLNRDIRLARSQAAVQVILSTSISVISILVIGWIGWGYLSIRRHRNAINRANIELQETVAERDEEIVLRKETEGELRVAKEDAERASHAKSQFLANMSHELRTPLNAIIGFAEIMSQELLGASGIPAYKGYSNDILGSGRHLLSIINDILDMARIDAGKATLHEENFDLGATVEDVLRMFQEEARSAGKILRIAACEPAVMVRADERFMRQILINLVSNSMKFTDDHGVIDVRLERTGDGGLDLIVADNGIGIPEDKLEPVMEAFGQVADTFARSRGGIGLGLPIVKSLAELHGGSFTLMSRLEKGTTARIHLPAQRVIAHQAKHAVLAAS